MIDHILTMTRGLGRIKQYEGMMGTFLERLKEPGVLVCDGAMGTMLHAMGLAPGECPEQWNLDQAEKVGSIAADYYAAGSDIVETNSFGGTCFKLEHYFKGLSFEELTEKVLVINRKAVEIARSKAGEGQFVFGSVGPTGQMLPPLGTVSEEAMLAGFSCQIKGLAEGGAHAICIETMSSIEEAEIALRAARNTCDLPVVVTFTFEKTPKNEYRTMMGVTPQRFAEHFTAAGADVIGSNCGNGIQGMVEICRELKTATDLPIMVQANAGLPVLEGGNTVFKETPEDMAAQVGDLVKNGARIIGGCCGTTPAHIAAMKSVLIGG